MTLDEAYKWRPTLCDCKNPFGAKCDCGQRQKNVDTLHEVEKIVAKDGSYVSDTEWLTVWGYTQQDIIKVYANLNSFNALKNS